MVKHIKKTHNIFYYMGIYYLIVLMVILVLGGYLLRYVYKTAYSDFLLGNKQHLSEIVNRHENDLQIVDNIVQQVQISDEITRFKLRREPAKATELMKQLKGYTLVSQYFDLLFYHYHMDDYLYHYSSSMSLEHFEEYGCILENQTPGQWEKLLKDKHVSLRILPEQPVYGGLVRTYLSGRESYTILMQTIPPKLEDTLMFFVPDTYYDQLLGDGVFGACADFIIYDGQIIVSRGSEMPKGDVLSQLVWEELKSKLTAGRVLQEQISIGTDSYMMTAQKGSSGLCYISIQHMQNFHDKMQTEQWAIILLILLCLIPALFLTFLGSKNILKKVKGFNQLLNEESFYDLNSIGNGIESLVSTYQKSEKELLVLKRMHFIRDFVRGSFNDRVAAIASAEQANLDIDYKQFCLVLLKNRELNNEDEAYSLVLESISNAGQVGGYGIHLISNNQNLFVLFGDEQENIEMVLEKMMEIERNYCQDYVVAVSDYHCDFEESSKAYLEADTAFDNHLLLDNSKIIRFLDVAGKESLSVVPESDLQRLKAAIRTNNKSAVMTAVNDICSKIGSENASLYSFRLFYNNIIHTLMSDWKGDKEKLDNFYNIFTLSQCLNINDFKSLLGEICMLIIDNQTTETPKDSDIVQDAIKYMQLNYQEPNLTMKGLAEYLGVSSVTLSVEFKNEMDITPFSYLNNLRVERAKEMLMNTDMLIKEIRNAVGFCDERVFERRFKKNTGMTPGQYRSQQKN